MKKSEGTLKLGLPVIKKVTYILEESAVKKKLLRVVGIYGCFQNYHSKQFRFRSLTFFYCLSRDSCKDNCFPC